jgi:murein DD-endopeptidase MepM/ murein hydrolase activator NlpD
LAGKKLAKFLTAVVLAMALLASPQIMPPTTAAASSLSELQKKQAQLKKQQAAIAAKLKSLKADKAKQVDYKNALDSQRATVQDQIDLLNQQIAALDQDIKDKESQIAAKQATISTNYAKLKERLHAMYLTGEASNLEIILSAKSIMDLSDKTEAIKAITTHDTDLINTLKSDMNSIKTQKAAIEANRQQVAAAKVAQDSKRHELSDLVSETNSVIAQISKDESSAQSESAKIAKEEQKAAEAIDQWYKDYYASHRSSSDSGGFVSTGNFAWPVPGVSNITSGFGYRWGSFHKGIDISSSGIYGKPIVAADSGKVIMAGYGNYGTGYGGYGNVVAINHGGGYSTLYGHCSSVAVSTGQVVEKGQVIAYVGSTGQSTGPHLHFEIRVDGVAKNPLNWFSRG